MSFPQSLGTVYILNIPKDKGILKFERSIKYMKAMEIRTKRGQVYPNLITEREHRGITSEAMAAIIRQSPENYKAKEEGIMDFKMTEVLDICKAFNMSSTCLFK